MKKYLALLLVLLLVLVFSIPVYGQGVFSYTAGIQVQNLETSDATVSLVYYNQDGSIDATVNDTILASGSKTYFPVGASSGFNGSVIISSDRMVAAIANILGDNGVAAASYVGTDTGATSVQLPLLMKDNAGFNTWYNVQNTGSSAATVNVAYSDGTAAGPVTIQPGASQTFFQANETHTASVFSAVITSDQPVVGTVIEESSDVMFAYSGFIGGSTNPVFPLINANNANYITGTQIQNLGGSDTDVTVSYNPSTTGTACTETQTIPAGESVTFTLAAFANGSNSDCTAGATFVGSAQVTGNTTSQDLAAIVNQLLPGVNGEAYGSFNPTQATDKVVLPLIMDRNAGYFTGFNIMHVGGPDATVTCTFTNSSYTVVSALLSSGDALTDLQNNQIASGYVGSATCTADNASAQIVGIVNELGSSSSSDQLLVYEGISGQ